MKRLQGPSRLAGDAETPRRHESATSAEDRVASLPGALALPEFLRICFDRRACLDDYTKQIEAQYRDHPEWQERLPGWRRQKKKAVKPQRAMSDPFLYPVANPVPARGRETGEGRHDRVVRRMRKEYETTTRGEGQ